MHIAYVLAGGTGTRMGSSPTPKQFLSLYGQPLLLHSLCAFAQCPFIDAIGLVVADAWQDTVRQWIARAQVPNVRFWASPGATRADSSFAALRSLEGICAPDDLVLLHDAARPLVSQRIIEQNIALARQYGAVNTVIAAQDTILQSSDGQFMHHTPDRQTLFQMQTPQTFRFDWIWQAHQARLNGHIEQPVTDDCTLVHAVGHPVALCPGEKRNIKVTTPEDLLFAQALLHTGA